MSEVPITRISNKNGLWIYGAVTGLVILGLLGCGAPKNSVRAKTLPARTPSYSAEQEGYFLGDDDEIIDDSPSARKATETPIATPPVEIKEGECVLAEIPSTTVNIDGHEMTKLPEQNYIGALYHPERRTFTGVISGRGGGFVPEQSLGELFVCPEGMGFLDSLYFRDFVNQVFQKHMKKSNLQKGN